MLVSVGPMESPSTTRFVDTFSYFARCISKRSNQACDKCTINSITLSDVQEGLLYWCDARTDKIERINLETGENRELVLPNNNMDMFAVSVFEDYIYWSDRCKCNISFLSFFIPPYFLSFLLCNFLF